MPQPCLGDKEHPRPLLLYDQSIVDLEGDPLPPGGSGKTSDDYILYI